jgi:hypothetical protein
MSVNQLLLEAIALKKCVAVTYNRTEMTLAPHILYTRHDELFVDAVALTRNGMPPREKKLGSFKIAGLSGLALAGQHFEAEPVFDPSVPRYEGTTLFAIEA